MLTKEQVDSIKVGDTLTRRRIADDPSLEEYSVVIKVTASTIYVDSTLFLLEYHYSNGHPYYDGIDKMLSRYKDRYEKSFLCNSRYSRDFSLCKCKK